MRAIVIGLGSMGKRRIRLLKSLDGIARIIGVDSKEERRKQVKEDLGIDTYSSIEKIEGIEEYTMVFVCTPPLSHYQVIDKCLDLNLHVFTEINLVAEGYDTLIEKASKYERQLFLSSTMLYREELKYIHRKIAANDNKVNYMYHVGQYLPDWHPWESYKEFFVNDVRSNGCRELFAIELPWIVKTFGKIKNITVQKSKMTGLEVNYPDNYMVMLSHESGHKGVLVVDVVARKAIRRLEITGEELFLTWEGSPRTLREYDYQEKKENFIETYSSVDKDSRYSENIIENAYLDEIKNFIKAIKKEEKACYSFEEDKEILSIIDYIENDTTLE